MGRTDAWALQLPEPPPVVPESETACTSPGAQILEMLGRSSAGQPAAVTTFTGTASTPETARPASPAATRLAEVSCPACKAKLSGVEQKMERCLTCGTSFSAGAGKVSVGI